jgi:hypothetical protein
VTARACLTVAAVTLGRSGIVERNSLTGEVPDLAPPPSHGPRLHTCCTTVSNLLCLINAHGGRAGTSIMEGNYQHAVRVQLAAGVKQREVS